MVSVAGGNAYDGRYIAAPGQFDGVVQLHNYESFSFGTGVLLSSGKHVLTAAHLLENFFGNAIVSKPASIDITFANGGGQTLGVSDIKVHPGYSPTSFSLGNDIAILELAAPAPADTDRYSLYRDHDEIGQIFTLTGYGKGGTGDGGALLSDNTLRYGLNSYDFTIDSFSSSFSFLSGNTSQLGYDFDNGASAQDYGSLVGAPHLGFGLDEVAAASGDSGGPSFINSKISGITSYGLNTSTDINAALPSTFGEVFFNTRVSYYAEWIDSEIGRSSGSVINLVDYEFYFEEYEDIAANGIDPLDHYNLHGRFEGRDPNFGFDTSYYLENNPDIAAVPEINPLEHYRLFGWKEGREPSETFNAQSYLQNNPDLLAGGVNPLEHFLVYGFFEGRDYWA